MTLSKICHWVGIIFVVVIALGAFLSIGAGSVSAGDLQALIKGLEAKDSALREKAAAALAKLGPGAKDAVPALIKALDDPEEDVRRRMPFALGKIGPAANRIIRRAGLTPWPKTFQNLRASRETELADRFPIHVVCEWIGNSPRVAEKHYLQVPEAYFEAAVDCSALQKALHRDATPSLAKHRGTWEPVKIPGNDGKAGVLGGGQYAWRDSNPQPADP